MTMPMEERCKQISKQLKLVIELLVAEKYEELDELTGKEIAPSREIVRAFIEDGNRLVNPPEEVYRNIEYHKSGKGNIRLGDTEKSGDVHVFEGLGPRSAWGVDFDVWTETGPSPWTLKLDFIESDDKGLAVVLEDLSW